MFHDYVTHMVYCLPAAEEISNASTPLFVIC